MEKEKQIRVETLDSSLFVNILKEMTESVVFIDTSGKIKFINPATIRLFGLKDKNYINQNIKKVISDESTIKIFLSACKKHEKVLNYEIPISFPYRKSVILNITPLFHNGNFEGIIGVFSDRTERRQIESEVREVDKATTLAGLTSWVAHEIRNPLNSMSIHLELLRENFSEKKKSASVEALKLINIMKEEIERLDMTVKEFLALNKPAKLKLKFGNINTVVEKLVEFISHEAIKQNIKIIKKINPNLPQIQFDELQVRQALLNILVNAIQSMSDGGELIIVTRQRGDNIFVDIKDTGIGIPREDIPLLFEYFFSTKEQGTGLGLTIANRIIKDHGGRILVKSMEGIGSTFTIKFPVQNKTETEVNDLLDGTNQTNIF